MKSGSAVDEWETIPISRLSQAGYCLRRAALITNEQLWSESSDTAKGRLEHDRVHDRRIEKRGDIICLYEYEVFSQRLGISGKCDCIEAVVCEDGCRIPSSERPVRLYPIEYKHGKLRDEEEYELQVCAQAMCLEDMYDTSIEEGAIFYTSSHRRQTVCFTPELREKVLATIAAVDDMRRSYTIPKARYDTKCKRCSMYDLCRPDMGSVAKSYCEALTREAIESEEL